MEEQVQELVAAYRAGRIERREFIRWAAILGLAVPCLDLTTARAAAPIRRATSRQRSGRRPASGPLF